MTKDEMLLGWLCIFRMNRGNKGGPFNMPRPIRKAILERGWIELKPDQKLSDVAEIVVTDSGMTASDLAAPEWGIDPIPTT